MTRMLTRLVEATAVVLTLALAGSTTIAVVYRAPITQTDALGDSLPPGALARLGTIRLRHLSAAVTFSADGQTLISAGADGTIRFWDPATGKEKRRVRVQTEASRPHPQLFDANAKTVAGTSSERIHVWETASGKELQRFPYDKITLPGLEDRWAMIYRLALSPDGQLLAAQFMGNRNYDLHLWNVRTGKKLFTLKLQQHRDGLAFSTDGKLLATSSFNDGIQLWDTATGKEVRKILGGRDRLAFSPDGKRLAAAGRGGVKVWNLADNKEIFELKPVAGRYPGALTFAPDSMTLCISFADGAALYDVVAGKRLRTIGTSYYGRLVFAPTGKTAAAFSGSAIHLWDVATGKEIGGHAGHESMVTAVAIAPDGGRIATFETGPQFHVWDAASGKPLLRVAPPSYYIRSGTFSPDGRFLVTDADKGTLRAWDSKTGAEVRKFVIEADGQRVGAWVTALSSDGDRLVALASGGDAIPFFQIHVWDFATGKRLARRGLKYAGFETRFSPDTRIMAPQTNDGVVTDTVTGQQLVKMTGHAPLAFSPDGQILATTLYRKKKPEPGGAMPAGGGYGGLPEAAEAIALTELATGEILTVIQTGSSGFSLLAYSPDGLTLATAGGDSFRLWDIATGKQLFRRALPQEYRFFGYSFATSLAFFPDGGRLATGLMDGTTLIWDLEPKTWHAGLAVKDLAPRDLERLWADLAAENSAAVKAHQAVWTLAAVPAKAVPFLKHHLHPAVALDAKQVQRLITDLDSPEFAVREAAQKKLASFGEQAEPALHRALEAKPPLETRKRLETLHTDAELAGRGIVHSPELLRTLRAIRILEHIGDREAQRVLQTLAAGDPAARSTQQARAALRRLKR